MAAFRRYPEYRDSGVEWLGKVPAHWHVVSLQRLTSSQPAAAFIERRKEAVWHLELKHIAPRTGTVLINHRSPVSKIGNSTVWFDESKVLNSRLRPYLDKVAKSGQRGSATSELIPLTPNPRFLTRSYLAYHLASPRFLAFASQNVSGTKMPTGIPTSFWNHPAPLPPLPEQRAIADFLDGRARWIDRLVAKKLRLVELLTEKRASLVSRAVTRGLNPDAPIRDSGVEWLGKVPAHWKVVELGRVGTFARGRGGSKLDEKDSGVPYVRSGDLYTYHDHHIVDTRSFLDDEAAKAYTPIRYGDVLFAASGETLEEIGKSAVNLVRSVTKCGRDVIVYRPECKWDPWFLGYQLGSAHASQQKATMGRVFTAVHIYIRQLRLLHTTVPPLPEQRAIADFIHREATRIDALVTKTQEAIELLREYRDSLISAAVTGQIDLRGPLPSS